MDPEVNEQFVGEAEAIKQLDAMEAAEGGSATGQAGAAKPGQPAAGESADTTADTRAAAGTEESKVNDKSNEAAPEAKSPKADEKPDEAKPGEQKPGEKTAEPSRFAKAQEREKNSWKDLNAQKDALRTEREAFQKEREQLQRDREQYQSERTKAESEFTTEQYEAAAKKFEAEGKFDLADLAKRKAEQLRTNPPQRGADKAAAASKEWALKAGIDFPDLAKANSPLQVRVAQLLKEEPEFSAHPKGIYVAARLASLETELHTAKTAAAALPKKDAELKQLTARVKELEALTAPGGEGGAQHLPEAKTFAAMSSDEQFAELHRQAASVQL